MYRFVQLAAVALVTMVVAPMDQLKAATYAFNATIIGPSASDGAPRTFPEVSISIQDIAVQSGSFSATYVGGPANFQGDYASLISFNIGSATTVTPTTGDPSTFRVNLLFNVDGSINAGALFYMGDNFKIDLGGVGDLFQGAFSTPDIGGEGFASGTFTAVPEPSSIVLTLAGIAGLGLLRRRGAEHTGCQ